MTASVCFITGTDTGVGKTWVSATWGLKALAEGQRVVYYKPIQTGTPLGEPPEDPHWITQATQGQITTHCGYCFEPPVTPWVADPEGTISFEKILADIASLRETCDLLLVEGAGGVLVPIDAQRTMLDLMAVMGAPVLLVSHVRLGTINHTLLSAQAIVQRGLSLETVVINGFPQNLLAAPLSTQTLPQVLRQYLPKALPLWACRQSEKAPLAQDLIRLDKA